MAAAARGASEPTPPPGDAPPNQTAPSGKKASASARGSRKRSSHAAGGGGGSKAKRGSAAAPAAPPGLSAARARDDAPVAPVSLQKPLEAASGLVKRDVLFKERVALKHVHYVKGDTELARLSRASTVFEAISGSGTIEMTASRAQALARPPPPPPPE